MTERILVAASENGSPPYATTLIDPVASEANDEVLVVGAALTLIMESIEQARDAYNDACDLALGTADWHAKRRLYEYAERLGEASEDEDSMLGELHAAISDMLAGGKVVHIRIRTASERHREITVAPPARADEEDARLLRLDLFDPDTETVGWA
ncbi:hypothetical protein [Prescottella equi]|uniref:hypothetical protein n=1 Tax=Rhodococcus hoagii TaxID=43767 RepID=UPI000D109D46|nr:hypothetical protein [Prescottella equi]AVP71240.1 hypothetical protein C7H75_24465 [Prescottella equi]